MDNYMSLLNLLREDARMTEKELMRRMGIGRRRLKQLIGRMRQDHRCAALIDFHRAGCLVMVFVVDGLLDEEITSHSCLNRQVSLGSSQHLLECVFSRFKEMESFGELLGLAGVTIMQKVYVLDTLKKEGVLLH